VAYAFGEYVLEVGRRELWRGGEQVEVEPQVFDLLVYLVQHRDRVLGRDDLLQAVWGGRIVSDSALTTRVNAARRALGDDGEWQRLIRTLPRRGFRFIGEVSEAPDGLRPSATASAAAERAAGATPPDGPSIAVLPLANIGGDAEQQSFADGAVEEIITALSRIGWLWVIARCSSFSYRERTVDAKRIGRELGVRYLLDGSVRKSGDRVRLSVQLVDTQTAVHLWAGRFDGTIGDVFALQEKVAIGIAGVIEPTVEAREIHGRAGLEADDLSVHDLYLRALPSCYSCSAQSLLGALDLLERAIARDPGFAPALATAAGCRQFLGCSGWAADAEENRRKAIDEARQALQANDHDPVARTEAARVLGYFTEQIGSAIGMIERALSLNPSRARLVLERLVQALCRGVGTGLRTFSHRRVAQPAPPSLSDRHRHCELFWRAIRRRG
jgi:TolB-like protein